MKYFELNELLLSLIYPTVYGMLGGTLYETVKCAVIFFKRLFLMPWLLLKHEGRIGFSSAKKEVGKINTRQSSTAVSEITDFIFFTLFGILYSIVSYVTLDGDFRMYSVAMALLAFFLLGRPVGRRIMYGVLRVLDALYLIIFNGLLMVLLPLRKLVRLTVIPIMKIAKQFHAEQLSRAFVRKRLREAGKIFAHCAKQTNNS